MSNAAQTLGSEVNNTGDLTLMMQSGGRGAWKPVFIRVNRAYAEGMAENLAATSFDPDTKYKVIPANEGPSVRAW